VNSGGGGDRRSEHVIAGVIPWGELSDLGKEQFVYVAAIAYISDVLGWPQVPEELSERCERLIHAWHRECDEAETRHE
jgi:hypothetical protein